MSTGATIKIGSNYLYRHADGYFSVTGIELLRNLQTAIIESDKNGDCINTNFINLLIRDNYPDDYQPNIKYNFTDSVCSGDYLYELITKERKFCVYSLEETRKLEKLIFFKDINKIIINHEIVENLKAEIYEYLFKLSIQNVVVFLSSSEYMNKFVIGGSMRIYAREYPFDFNKCAELAENIKNKFNLSYFSFNTI